MTGYARYGGGGNIPPNNDSGFAGGIYGKTSGIAGDNESFLADPNNPPPGGWAQPAPGELNDAAFGVNTGGYVEAGNIGGRVYPGHTGY
ncbi:unnamed protein product [Didymodactylos carnosus]|uniref:Uncharacterized protein n=1 Tax=Didymodactylos carnosus TaxID=1234261 RepID=A0A8S2XCR8_9BILA|nr:unnamed protein product [Didymodactylos carnosus]CAF3578336.1 unnamed protein product [Didymodactylos carnosus]CAF4490887.1 unnamed protein product [Didymodactylos carnosus]